MKKNNLNRVPHVIGKTNFNGKDSIYIIGKTDQIDGQAHFILAWAKLSLNRGSTSFEDSTWNFVSELMNRSTEKPYFRSDEEGNISNLVYNFNFEHSRSIPTNYDLLTQCFVGSALNSMIELSKNRNDYSNLKKWENRLKNLKNGINQFMTRNIDGKKIYLELLLNEDHKNRPFNGFSWVNLSPIAAQWEPLDHSVFVNTIITMQSYTIQSWNNLKWMPTQWNLDSTFSGQMIGKGIGWELEFSRKEKDWERVLDILNMLKTIQNDKLLFMENSYLTNGNNKSIQKINGSELRNYENGIWKIVDAGNGEQTAWWCWAIAKMRKNLGMNAKPLKLSLPPKVKILNEDNDSTKIKIIKNDKEKIYYTIDGTKPNKNSILYKGIFSITKPTTINVISYEDSILSNFGNLTIPSKYNGLEFTYYKDIINSNSPSNIQSVILATGYTKNFKIVNNLKLFDHSIISEDGYIKIARAGNYKFYLITKNQTNLFIDGKLISSSNNKNSTENFVKSIHLNQTFHKIKIEFEPIGRNEIFEIYFSLDGEIKEKLDSNMLLIKTPSSENILRPQILPLRTEFDINEKFFVKVISFDDAEIFYSIDGNNPTENSKKYKGPFQIFGSAIIKAISQNKQDFSPIAVMRYKQTENTLIKIAHEPSKKYYANGKSSLIDGKYGTTNFGDGNWLGFEGEDLDVTLDLRKVILINQIKTEFLNNPGSWIFLPKYVKIYVSEDGNNYDEVFFTQCKINEQKIKNAEIKHFNVNLDNKNVRFIRLVAVNIKVCPKWHTGDGNKAWLFIDEISYN